MAWIELHQGLSQHHKIRRLKRLLGIGVAQAAGHMALLWTWALDATPAGDLSAFEAVDVAEQAEWEGDPDTFIEALVYAGLVDREDGRLVIHDWMEYAGRLVEKRRADTERKRMSRGRPTDIHATAHVTVPNRTVPNQEIMSTDVDEPMPDVPFEVGPYPLTPAEDDLDLEAVFPERSEGVVSNTSPRRTQPAPKPRDRYSPEFLAWWDLYPGDRRVDKGECFKKWRAALSSGVSVDELMAGLRAWMACEDWLKDGGAYVCAPLVWLNKKRWEEAPRPARSGGGLSIVIPQASEPVPGKWEASPEVKAKPWFSSFEPYIGTKQGVAMALANWAVDCSTADPSEVVRALNTKSLRAAGDMVWERLRA